MKGSEYLYVNGFLKIFLAHACQSQVRTSAFSTWLVKFCAVSSTSLNLIISCTYQLLLQTQLW